MYAETTKYSLNGEGKHSEEAASLYPTKGRLTCCSFLYPFVTAQRPTTKFFKNQNGGICARTVSFFLFLTYTSYLRKIITTKTFTWWWVTRMPNCPVAHTRWAIVRGHVHCATHDIALLVITKCLEIHTSINLLISDFYIQNRVVITNKGALFVITQRANLR